MMQTWRQGGLLALALLLPLGGCSNGPAGEGDEAPLGTQREALTLTGTELVGRPTATSVTVHALADAAVEAYFDYGTAPGAYSGSTSPLTFANGIIKSSIGGLTPNTRYYYRTRYRASGSTGAFSTGTERTFHTQRARGSSFTFAVQTDSHQGFEAFYSDALYATTLGNIQNDQPDLLLDLGDTFSLDSGSGSTSTETEATVRQKYLDQRGFFALAGHSSAVFLVLGNHENEEGWNLNDFGTNVQNSLPVLGANARKRYFVNPIPDGFYTGNLDASVTQIDGDHLKEDYYAFEWGDALFVALDPFWYTMKKPFANGAAGGELNEPTADIGNRWDWTLGITQYLWLKQTLEQSTAKYKFVFAHHLVGGTEDYSRGGALGAKYVEWGGYDTDGVTWGFSARRPAAQGWTKPIHELLVDNNVSIFFHGHDHFFAKEDLDGIVYQECPHAANDDYGGGFANNAATYPNAVRINNSGHLRITVSPAAASVEYVRAYLPGDEGVNGRGFNRDVAYTYSVAPNGPCVANSECDDGNACTTDTCNAGSCGSTPVVCNDGNACTVDACNSATGQCGATPLNCDDADPCTTDACASPGGCSHAPIPNCTGSAARLEAKTLTVGASPVTVPFSQQYVAPVVVSSVRYRNNTLPVVTRVSGVTGGSFVVRLQNPSGGAVLAETVDYLVMEQGAWDFNGVRCEAQRVSSTLTDSDSSWVAQARTYLRSYTSPVVLGQVMSENDPGFSAFWSRGSSATNPPSATSFYAGKHVGEDSDTTRSNETLGIIVCESGRGSVSDTPFEVKLGADTISGAGDAPPYLYSFTPAFSATPAVAVVSQSAMDGTNGGWAQLHGATPLTASTLALSVDEDQLSDSERSHTNEQVAYAVFQANVVYPDGCPADPAKTSPGACGCGVPEVPNCSDECPSDPAKTAPGACGCGVPDTDSDGDGTPNCIDGCPADAAKLAPGVCGCGSSDADSDGDGTPNCNDGCPTDAAKLAPGVCGCGSSDADSDGDGTPNCNDACPTNPAKLSPGICGCGALDVDSDSDGTLDCQDGCPSDPAKTSPGVCGCGAADVDGDADGAADCQDGCPADPAKLEAGACGCGVAETDSDSDGIPDCIDTCSGSCGYPLEFITAAVSGTASTLLLSQSYVDPVVVCSAEYRANTRPVVVRVNNVLSNRFDVRLQNPSNQAVSSETVSCLVVEAGAWTVGGVKLEAQKYLSTVTDRATSWVGQRRTYLQSYTSPVVLGQVMSMNDASWSVFWSQGNTRTNPPSPTRLSTGKMVGEDTDITRADEVVGFVVIEAGHGTLAGVEYEAALGPDTVLGTGDTPPYTYTFRSRFAAQPRGAVVTMSAMDGTNGGWAQLFGSAPLSTTELRLAIDEDQISDSERSHANEQVAYVAFGSR